MGTWQTEAERSAAAMRLLDAAGLSRRGLWDSNGPTELAWKLRGRRTTLSHGEHVILRIALDIWNGQGGATFADVLEVLDARLEARVGLLLVAHAAGNAGIWVTEGS